MDENDVITRNKARLVANEYSPVEGINYEETYAPVTHLEVIRLLLTFACCLNFKLYQIDVKLTLCNCRINKEVYVSQLPKF